MADLSLLERMTLLLSFDTPFFPLNYHLTLGINCAICQSSPFLCRLVPFAFFYISPLE